MRRQFGLMVMGLMVAMSGVAVGQVPVLVSSEPVAGGTLPKVQNNVILLTFDEGIALPSGSALWVMPLPGGADLGDQFDYSVEADGVTLRAVESGTVLVNKAWYRIRPSGDFGVVPFVLDVYTLVGDADGSGQVKALDLGVIWSHKNEVTDARWDIDGSGQVKALDLGAAWAHKNEALPDKPADPSVEPEFVGIAGGSFTMGDSFYEGSSNERPLHGVTLSGFEMSEHEVTNGFYAAFLNEAMAAGQVTVDSGGVVYGWGEALCDTTLGDLDSGISYVEEVFGVVAGKGDHPMVLVSWYGAEAFCEWYGYRLPSEAEWEYAARGGEEGQRFPWSDVDTIQHARANYESSSRYAYDTSPTRGYHPTFSMGATPYTSPVGSFSANGYGLFDMAGNVFEWCNDWYDSSYYSISPPLDPQGPSTGTSCVLRGGSWNYGPNYARCADRTGYTPTGRDSDTGFRVVRDL